MTSYYCLLFLYSLLSCKTARLKSDGRYYTVRGDHAVALHPTSVLAKYGAPPEWVIYHDVILTTQEYIRDNLKIRPQWLMELAPHFYQFRGGKINLS